MSATLPSPILRLAAPLALLAIVGCTTTPIAPAPAVAAPAPVVTVDAGGDPLPEVELTGALVFQLMAAELALQRGDAASAFAAYLNAARQTRDPRLARRATEIAVGARATTEALDAAALWRELAPGSTEARQTSAVLLVGAGRYDEAAALLAALVQSTERPLEALRQIQRLLLRAPDRAAALDLLTRLAQPYREQPQLAADVLLILAGSAQAAGQPKRALEHAQEAAALRPDDARAVLAVAQLLARPGGQDDAAGRARASELLAAFLARNPQAIDVRLARARLLVAERSYQAARDEFARVAAQDERNLDALYALGVLSLDRPALRAEARAYFKRFLELASAPSAASGHDPDAAILNLARLAEEERDFAGALAWLERIDGGEQYLAARQRKALVLGKLKRVDEGRRVLAETQTESAAERQQLVLTEGQLLREAGRYKEALGLLEGALKQTPEDTALLYEAALAAEQLDRIEQMEGFLRRAIELRPDDAHLYNALGYTLADRNLRLKEAHALIVRALALAPEDAYILDSMGWVYFRLGDLAKARAYLERAWRGRPHAEIGAHLGETLWVLGEREAARAIWREAKQLEPDNETLQSTLRRLKVRLAP